MFPAVLFALLIISFANGTLTSKKLVESVKDAVTGQVEKAVTSAAGILKSITSLKEVLKVPNKLVDLVKKLGVESVLAAIQQLQSLNSGKGTTTAAEILIALSIIEHLDEAPTLAEAAEELGNPKDYPPHYSPKSGEEFDFLIVGGGMGGCVAANRLSEVAGWKVLLLEAGGDPIKSMDVPGLAPTYYNTEVDWQYLTEPDGKSCLGFKEKKCTMKKGKVLGGSFAMSYNIYATGDKTDYDRLAAEGLTGWSWKDVLPYFVKYEDMRIKEVQEYSPGRHGTKGYLNIENWVDYGTFNNYFDAAMEKVGYPLIPDFNGFNFSAHSRMQGMMKNGRRCTPAKAYLTPIKERRNLKVSRNSLVTKVLINESPSKAAYGVQFVNKEGKTITVKAKKEIILSAGSIASPQLLMLSGVGPKKHLEEFKIKVKADLPVGKNFQDISICAGLLIKTNYSDVFPSPTKSMYDFLKKKPGFFNNALPLSRSGVISTKNNVNYPNGFIAAIRFPKNNPTLIQSFVSNGAFYEDFVAEQYSKLNAETDFLLPFIGNMQPFSRGRIELRSVDPTVHPKIMTGFLSDERDFDVLLSFYDFITDLVNTPGFKEIGAKIYEIKVPDCEKEFVIGSREYRKCSLRYLSFAILQTVGTCRMGAADSPDAVVDPRLRVRGIKNLRVLDYSVIPNANRGNGFVVAERGIDLVKEDWKS